jgi:hypothetical protein
LGCLGGTVEKFTAQIECMDSLGSWVQSWVQSLSPKLLKFSSPCLNDSYEVVRWADHYTKIPNPSETRGSFFEKIISPWRILVPLHFFVNFLKAKTPLQSRFTLLKSKFFPAKFSFYKIQKKNLAGKNTLQRSEVLFCSAWKIVLVLVSHTNTILNFVFILKRR